jgi:hypothetical protein
LSSTPESREYVRNWWAEKRRTDWAYEMFLSAKKRAKRDGLEFTITKDDIKIPEHCPILGCKLEKNIGRVKYNSPSLDRVDTLKGYVPGNVQVISTKANTHKGDLSLEEARRLVAYMERPSS